MQSKFKRNGPGHDERIEFTLCALLTHVPSDLFDLMHSMHVNELTEEGVDSGPNGEQGLGVFTDPEEIRRISEDMLELVDVPKDAVLIFARWSYNWNGCMNDHDQLKALDSLVLWLEKEPPSLITADFDVDLD